MHRSRSLPALLATAGLVAAGAALAPTAAAAPGPGSDGDLLRASLRPSLPSDDAVRGTPPGGAPWVLDDGEVRLRSDGRLDVRVEGLLIPRADGSADNPLDLVSATVSCLDGTGNEVRVRTGTYTFDDAGDARFRASLQLPTTCDDPVVLLNPLANPGAYIASTA